MSLRLNGSTSCYSEIDAPAIAGNNTLVLPTTNGAANQLLKNGSTPGVLEYSLTTLDSSGNLGSIASINGGPLAGFRNRIINGDFDIAQRGTSFAAIANGTYSLDRWAWGQAGAMVCTVTQSTDVPNNTFQSSYKVDVTTVDSSIAAGDFATVIQAIEGYNVRDLIGTTFTLSFWVKSPNTGAHSVGFRNGTVNRSHIKEYTITTANTWEYKTLTVNGGLITAGSWDWTNGSGLNVVFTLACGTTYQNTADAWHTGNFFATANQVNVMDNTANDFFLTGVQIEPGPVATPFERRPIGTELALCQRYFQLVSSFGFGYAPSGSQRAANPFFMTEMRAVPSIVVTGATGVNCTGQAAVNIGTRSFGITTTVLGLGGYSLDTSWTASAEL